MYKLTRHQIIAALYKIVIEADFKAVEKKFLATPNIDKQEIQDYLKKFKHLRDQHRITNTDKKNIDYWGKQDFSLFKDFVDSLSSEKSKRNIKKSIHKEAVNVPGAGLVAENKDWLVYQVDDYDAAKILGSRNWCVVRDYEHWMDYTSGDPTSRFYFILAKDRPEDEWHKIAIEVYSNGGVSIWDALDKEHHVPYSKTSKTETLLNELNGTYELNIPEFTIHAPKEVCEKCREEKDYHCLCCSICGSENRNHCGCCQNCGNSEDYCTCCSECGSTDRSNCGCWCANCRKLKDDCYCCSECGSTYRSNCGCWCANCSQLMDDCECCSECHSTDQSNCGCWCPACGKLIGDCICEEEEKD